MERPGWLDREEYPFGGHTLALPAGRMHYVDEGSGTPVVMLHGTPDWSFGYRRLVRDLSPDYRCVAPDQLGFGLSEKPAEYSYHPAEQAANLTRLIEHRELKDVTLVCHDFGGPIGLSYALDHPENVRGLVLMNTWMWSLRGDPHFERFERLFGGALGRFLYLRLGFSARVLMPHAYGDRKKLTPRIHAQYLRPLATPADRRGTWGYARALLGASDWYASLWERRERIADHPALILWGMRDIAFRETELQRLETIFRNRRTVRLPDVGHFVQEEGAGTCVAEVRSFLKSLSPSPCAAL